ncbi:MAG: aldo/keto reductase, partial [Acidobacteriota bacterium]|nr:aldo/keto reductase [Acidobacteriota bacterium]
WVEEGNRRLGLMRPIAERHGLTPLQLACAWNLAQPAVRCVVPTLIQEPGPGARAIESKRAELGAIPELLGAGRLSLSPDELSELAAIGANHGCMALKGASPEHDGPPLPDRWEIEADDVQAAARWNIDPARDLVRSEPVTT